MKKGWYYFGAALLLLTMAAVFGIARLNNSRLRTRVAESRDQLKRTEWIMAQNIGIRRMLEYSREQSAAGVDLIQDELRNARAMLTKLEQKAGLAAIRVTAESAAEKANEDPEKGLVPLRNFRKAGLATPGAAFQTAIWAVMKDDRKTSVAVVSMTAPARIKAATLLANLPASARARYPDPESLAVLAVATQVLRGTEFEILGSEPNGAADVRLKLRVARGADVRTFELPMILSSTGWQIVVSEESINSLRLSD